MKRATISCLAFGLTLATPAPAPQILPFSCTTTVTYTAPPVVATSVDYVVDFITEDLVITLPATTTTVTTYTTTYSPVSESCFTSGTTLTPTTLAPTHAKREEKATPAITAAPAAVTRTLGDIASEVTLSSVFFNFLNPYTCTEVVEAFGIIATTETATATVYELATTVPTSTATLTGTVVQPTPASYDGLNYYQYINDYNYGPGGTKVNTGYGGGGYATSDWRGNYGYQTNGQQNPLNFESPGWPNGPYTCQLDGQPGQTDCSQWTIVFQGFLFAQYAGNYTITADGYNDNEVVVWGGDKSYRSYTDENSDLVWYVEGAASAFTYTLAAGELYPLTIINSNGGGPMRLYLQVAAPGGIDYTNSPDFLVSPCDVSDFIP